MFIKKISVYKIHWKYKCNVKVIIIIYKNTTSIDSYRQEWRAIKDSLRTWTFARRVKNIIKKPEFIIIDNKQQNALNVCLYT